MESLMVLGDEISARASRMIKVGGTHRASRALGAIFLYRKERGQMNRTFQGTGALKGDRYKYIY